MALSHEQAEQLLGAYALNAIDDDERVAVDAHVQECSRCAAELAEHRETASWLADTTEAAPAGVWAGIDDKIGRGRGPAVVIGMPRAQVVRALAVAAAVALFLGIAAVVVQQQREIDALKDQSAASGLQQEALRALTVEGARHAVLTTGDGEDVARVVVKPDGTGFIVEDDLPALEPTQTYQLWALVDGQPISAGVLGADPDLVPFRFAGPAAGVAVSIEKASGAQTPTEPLASGLFEPVN